MQNMICFTVTTASALDHEGLGRFLPGGSRQSQSRGASPKSLPKASISTTQTTARSTRELPPGPAGHCADKKGQMSGTPGGPTPEGAVTCPRPSAPRGLCGLWWSREPFREPHPFCRPQEGP